MEGGWYRVCTWAVLFSDVRDPEIQRSREAYVNGVIKKLVVACGECAGGRKCGCWYEDVEIRTATRYNICSLGAGN